MQLNTTHRAVIRGQEIDDETPPTRYLVEVEVLETKHGLFGTSHRVAYEHTHVHPTDVEMNYTTYEVTWIKDKDLLGKLE